MENSFAAAVSTIYTGKINESIAQAVTTTVARAGVAANDARVIATTNAIGIAATSLLGSLPSCKHWACTLLTASMTGASWCLSSTGCSDYISNLGSGVSVSTSTPVPKTYTLPDTFWASKGLNPANCTMFTYTDYCSTPLSSFTICSFSGLQNPSNICLTGSASTAAIAYFGVTGTPSASGFLDEISLLKGAQKQTVTSTPVTTADALAAAIPTSDLSNRLPANLIADLTNALWKIANASAVNGIAYSPSNPVTVDAVSTTSQPTVQDFLSPATPAGQVSSTSTVPISPTASLATPATQSTSSTSTSATSGSTTNNTTNNYTTNNTNTMDLGTAPSIPDPTTSLSSPLASDILSPIFDLFPDLKAYSVPSHVGTCPTASFQILGNSYTINYQCTLFESFRSLLASVMVLCYTLVALFIVLKA